MSWDKILAVTHIVSRQLLYWAVKGYIWSKQVLLYL